MKKWIRPLASIKLAVINIVLLATVTAVGTFVEAYYGGPVGAEIAGKLVYKTPWMFGAMGLLAINLIAVMVDRWPWKRRHVPFLLAHVGILALQVGSVITMIYGLDGNMVFGIGQKNRFVQVPTTEFMVWMSFDGERYSRFVEKEVDFFKKPPGDKNVYMYPLGEGELKILEYWPFARSSRKVEVTDSPVAGSAIRFQIQNAQFNQSEWLVQRKKNAIETLNFGPAKFHIGKAPNEIGETNELYIWPVGDRLEYTVFYKDKLKKPLHGSVKEGDSFQTGWMGIEFRVLRFLPKAEEKFVFEKAELPSELTTAAVRVSFLGKEHWLQLNDNLKLFTENTAYIVSYGNKRIDLGYELFLKDFQMGTYPGTQRAASYQSIVQLPENADDHTISMNEPLKYKGLTFYQASFIPGPTGKPVASVLSVNHDPGRFLKYLGSLIISLGVIWLFYDKRKSAASSALKAKSELKK